MKKLTRKEKIDVDKQLKKKKYVQGEHDILVGEKVIITVSVQGKQVFFPSGRRLPVPEEWWV